MRWFLAAMVFAWIGSSPAWPCSPAYSPELVIDQPAGETAPPTAPEVTGSIYREEGPSGCEDQKSGGLCSSGDVASIVLEFHSTDDVTPREELGYMVRVVGGTPPARLATIPNDILVDEYRGFSFDYDDDSGFALDFEIHAVDRNGNAGPSTIVTVMEAGDGGACSGGRSGGGFALIALVGAVVLRRRRTA